MIGLQWIWVTVGALILGFTILVIRDLRSHRK